MNLRKSDSMFEYPVSYSHTKATRGAFLLACLKVRSDRITHRTNVAGVIIFKIIWSEPSTACSGETTIYISGLSSRSFGQYSCTIRFSHSVWKPIAKQPLQGHTASASLDSISLGCSIQLRANTRCSRQSSLEQYSCFAAMHCTLI